jgi:hypothetical protein
MCQARAPHERTRAEVCEVGGRSVDHHIPASWMSITRCTIRTRSTSRWAADRTRVDAELMKVAKLLRFTNNTHDGMEIRYRSTTLRGPCVLCNECDLAVSALRPTRVIPKLIVVAFVARVQVGMALRYAVRIRMRAHRRESPSCSWHTQARCCHGWRGRWRGRGRTRPWNGSWHRGRRRQWSRCRDRRWCGRGLSDDMRKRPRNSHVRHRSMSDQL